MRGRDIKRYGYVDNGLYLINTHNGVRGRIPRIKIERKLKSLTTMMANLQERRASIQREIEEIARSLGEEGTDNIVLTARIKSLRQEMENIIFLHSFLCFFTVSCSRLPSLRPS